MGRFDSCSWPLDLLSEAVEALARAAGLSRQSLELPPLPASLQKREDVGTWIGYAAARLGLEAEPVETPYAELDELVRGCVPAVVRIEGPVSLEPAEGEASDPTASQLLALQPRASAPRFLLLLRCRRSRVQLLAPDGERCWVAQAAVRDALARPLEDPVRPQVEALLERVGLQGRKRERTCRLLLRERLASRPVAGCWLLRLSSGAGFWQQARVSGELKLAWQLVGMHLLSHGLMLLSWAMLGRGILADTLDFGYMSAWALVLLSSIPLRLRLTWLQGKLAIGLGGLLKQRLLHGALSLEPEETRHLGAGQLMGRVMESEAVTSLALGGGFQSIFGLMELVAAAAVLWLGSGGSLHLLLFGLWMLVVGVLAWRYLRSRWRWTDARLDLTHDLVERMIGNRTRLVQEARESWHSEEDAQLDRYVLISRRMDALQALVGALFSRGWMVIGLLGLGPALAAGSLDPAGLAVGLGGVLLADRALKSVTLGISQLAGALIAWDKVRFMFEAAGRESALPTAEQVLAGFGGGDSHEGQVLLDASDLVFRYADRPEPVLRSCSLKIAPGERILLEGPSGGGKSTLASILVGLRAPSSGLLLLQGLDRHSLGPERWRRWVAAAPQFHENHVLTHTFAFNLLMGRRWPPEQGDLEEATQLCEELGLRPLLERMPSGLNQMVGETGWQLSHGEKSRLYLARALLQNARLLVLDESFAALDPESLKLCLSTVLRRAPTLMVIAHP